MYITYYLFPEEHADDDYINEMDEMYYENYYDEEIEYWKYFLD